MDYARRVVPLWYSVLGSAGSLSRRPISRRHSIRPRNSTRLARVKKLDVFLGDGYSCPSMSLCYMCQRTADFSTSLSIPWSRAAPKTIGPRLRERREVRRFHLFNLKVASGDHRRNIPRDVTALEQPVRNRLGPLLPALNVAQAMPLRASSALTTPIPPPMSSSCFSCRGQRRSSASMSRVVASAPLFR
jgi:hypothetical protein